MGAFATVLILLLIKHHEIFLGEKKFSFLISTLTERENVPCHDSKPKKSRRKALINIKRRHTLIRRKERGEPSKINKCLDNVIKEKEKTHTENQESAKGYKQRYGSYFKSWRNNTCNSVMPNLKSLITWFSRKM